MPPHRRLLRTEELLLPLNRPAALLMGKVGSLKKIWIKFSARQEYFPGSLIICLRFRKLVSVQGTANDPSLQE